MPSSTVEDYIKQMYLEQQRGSGELVPMGRLAEVMGVVPGTATAMMKTLSDAGLVDYEARVGARLTPGGERLALHVLRRHRILELFLVKVLGMDWWEVHEEAERLEHAVSDKVLERLDTLLDSPRVDPHGDPIPTASGRLHRSRLDRLTDCEAGAVVVIERIEDQAPRFLQFIDRSGLTPGTRVTLVERCAEAEAVTIAGPGSCRLALGHAAASKILVRRG